MKKIRQDSINIYPDTNYVNFKRQLLEAESKALNMDGCDEIKSISFGYDGDINIHFLRLETDYEYEYRTKKDQELINKELRELERLKAKYE